MRTTRAMAARDFANRDVNPGIYYSRLEKKLGMVPKRKVVRVNGKKWANRGTSGN
jgi:hypothetical protein